MNLFGVRVVDGLGKINVIMSLVLFGVLGMVKSGNGNVVPFTGFIEVIFVEHQIKLIFFHFFETLWRDSIFELILQLS